MPASDDGGNLKTNNIALRQLYKRARFRGDTEKVARSVCSCADHESAAGGLQNRDPDEKKAGGGRARKPPSTKRTERFRSRNRLAPQIGESSRSVSGERYISQNIR